MSTSEWSARGHIIFGGVGLLVLVLGFGGWSVSTNIAGAVIASGRIEVRQDKQVVQHPDGGVVSKIFVTEGQSVVAGDALIRLDDRSAKTALAIIENQYYELTARSARLTAERSDATEITFSPELNIAAKTKVLVRNMIAGQKRLFHAERNLLAQRTDVLKKQKGELFSRIGGIDVQSSALTTQLGLVREELSNQKGLLKKGLTQASNVLQLRLQKSRIIGSLGLLAANRAQAQEKITETSIEILKLRSTRNKDANTKLRDLSYRELNLAERRRSLVDKIEHLVIRAPSSGRVFGLVVTTPHSVIRAAEPIMYIVPQDRPLVIAAKVKVVHVDQVHLGQKVQLKFSAFHDRSAPDIFGHITLVSADAFTDKRTQVPYYRLEIKVDTGQHLGATRNKLVPGMEVEAFIQTGNRTPLSYLIKPFTDYFSRAFRES